ncbi:MAG: hypothetical protein JHC26_02105 [Thermofilum sp.]|uniref:hypothetical protein n=1 Tax=Thermofilum sp. TaxID=1961369 RepID=UPI002590F7A5|nr:hypothetical protein [Thermofilum sp.]MCI4407857.1 hypothetical protein [Thermofilum sp.]
MSAGHTGMVKELIEKPSEKIEATYRIVVIDQNNDDPLSVFPETIERMRRLEADLTEPISFAEGVRKMVKQDDARAEYEKARAFFVFAITPDAEQYLVLRYTIICGYRALHQTALTPLNDAELKTQLKYALKIRELEKALNDCNKKLEQQGINKEQETDK